MVKTMKETEYGVIPSDWGVVPIGEMIIDIADGPFGSNLKAEHYTKEHEARIVQLSNIGDDGWKEENTKYTTFEHAREITRSIVNSGEVIMAKMMPAGRSIICPSKEKMYVLSSDAVRIHLNEKVVNAVYFIYATKSQFFLNQIGDDIQGSTRARTSITKIKKNTLPLPELQEQVAIASVLSEVDNLIKNLQKEIEKKKNIKYGVLQKLITGEERLQGFNDDWIPINLAKKSKLKARIGWQGLTTAEYLESGYAYLVTGTDFEDGHINWDECHFVTSDRYFQDINIQLTNGDVLITKDGTIGKVALVDGLTKPATLNSGVFVVRPINNAYSAHFLYYVLESRVFRDFLDMLSAGSTIVHLYQKDLVNFSFMAPRTIQEQEAIASIIYDMDCEVRKLEKKLRKYQKIKQGMMRDLLTGKIRLV